MKIALLGSTGYVGSELLKACIEGGHQIKVLVRNPSKLAGFRKTVEVIEGDYFDKDKVAETIAGSEIVISTIGPVSKTPENITQYIQSMINAMKNLVSIMEKENVKKVILIGGAATPVIAHEKFNMRQKLIKFMLNSAAKHIIFIKTSECSILTKSKLNWIIIRPPAITKGAPTGYVKADAQKLFRMRIDRADLVDFVLKQVTSDSWLHKAPLVCSMKG